LPIGCNVTIKIYDAYGREVTTLVNAYLAKGTHKSTWTGISSDGSFTPSGIYFYQMQAGAYTKTKKMIKLQ